MLAFAKQCELRVSLGAARPRNPGHGATWACPPHRRIGRSSAWVGLHRFMWSASDRYDAKLIIRRRMRTAHAHHRRCAHVHVASADVPACACQKWPWMSNWTVTLTARRTQDYVWRKVAVLQAQKVDRNNVCARVGRRELSAEGLEHLTHVRELIPRGLPIVAEVEEAFPIGTHGTQVRNVHGWTGGAPRDPQGTPSPAPAQENSFMTKSIGGFIIWRCG